MLLKTEQEFKESVKFKGLKYSHDGIKKSSVHYFLLTVPQCNVSNFIDA